MDTVFIDESKTRGYTLVAVTVPSADLVALRRQVALLRKNGQSRVHMVKESDPRRRFILSTLCRLGVRARVYRVTGCDNASSRERCLRAVAADAIADGSNRIVLERDDSIERLDRLILRRELEQAGSQIRYSHETASHDGLLSLPDAIAWSFVRGGAWRTRITPLLTSVADLSG